MAGPVLSQSVGSVIQIMRNVTGRVDENDPSFTDAIMTDYLNAFLQQEHPQEVRLFQNQSWWEFTIDTTTADPLTVDLDTIGYSTINSPAYISTVAPNTVNSFRLSWYLDPGDFYARWPWNTTFTTQMPTSVLYYNDQLTFRGPPDTTYSIRIAAYEIDEHFQGGTIDADTGLSNVPQAYLTRYLAYGASLDILSDYSEMAKYNEIFAVYRRYRAQVLARTWNQLQSQRTSPEF